MLVKAVQKIYLQGNSAVITLPRRLLIPWELQPGAFIELLLDTNTGLVTMRAWGESNVSKSPGVIGTAPPELPR